MKKNVEKAARIKPWSEDEISFILKNIGPVSDQAVANHLGRSVDSVRKWVQRYDDKRLCR